MLAHEKLQVYGKALDFAAQAASWTSTWDNKHALVDLDVERALLAETEASAGKEMLRRISAMVAGFETLSHKVDDKVRTKSASYSIPPG